MDSNLEKALEFSNYMSTLENQKRILKEKFKEETVHYYNGGQFTIDTALIAYVNSHNSEFIILDDNLTPILIKDAEQFSKDINTAYNTALKKYYDAYENLKTSRSVEKLIELD